MPLHLVGGGVALDNPTPGVTARAPQSMVQDFLNRSRRCLWGIVSNGHIVRLLRDASSLTKQSYVEFDLDDIFGNQRYAEFRLFFLTIHASRLTPIAPEAPAIKAAPAGQRRPRAHPIESALDLAEDAASHRKAASLTPDSCWLEQWRTAAIADGTRALDALRDGVALALTHLGTGFVSHPGNSQLTRRCWPPRPTRTRTCTGHSCASPTGSSCSSSPRTAQPPAHSAQRRPSRSACTTDYYSTADSGTWPPAAPAPGTPISGTHT